MSPDAFIEHESQSASRIVNDLDELSRRVTLPDEAVHRSNGARPDDEPQNDQDDRERGVDSLSHPGACSEQSQTQQHPGKKQEGQPGAKGWHQGEHRQERAGDAADGAEGVDLARAAACVLHIARHEPYGEWGNHAQHRQGHGEQQQHAQQ